jgi:molybdate transport system regulatory protein
MSIGEISDRPLPGAVSGGRPRKKTKPGGALRLVDGEILIGGGLNTRLFELLAAIDRIGSINRAAKAVGMSYKGAWEMIERANNLSPRALIETATGGREGGGTRLSETGRSLLSLFVHIREEHRQFLARLNEELGHDPVLLQWLRRLFMKASARNQWAGRVAEIHRGAVNAEVLVTLNGGAGLVASITKESVESLGLKQGKEVLALVKAPMVMVMTDLEGYRLSARNQLTGQIAHLHQGPVSTDVVIGLPGGDSVVASITSDSCEALGLAPGQTATAVFKASAVILGVAG